MVTLIDDTAEGAMLDLLAYHQSLSLFLTVSDMAPLYGRFSPFNSLSAPIDLLQKAYDQPWPIYTSMPTAMRRQSLLTSPRTFLGFSSRPSASRLTTRGSCPGPLKSPQITCLPKIKLFFPECDSSCFALSFVPFLPWNQLDQNTNGKREKGAK